MASPCIHLIEKEFQIKPSLERPGLPESGYWKYLKEDELNCLIGGKIYFHYERIDRAYKSGTIVSYRHNRVGEREGSIVFFFKEDEIIQREQTDGGGWEPANLQHIGFHPYRKIIGC